MNEQEKLWGTPSNFETTYQEIANYYSEKGLSLKPLYTQDGSEIHPKLAGITFNFWGKPDDQEGQIAVNFEGREDDETLQLNGGVYNSFSDAKAALRAKAQEIFKDHSLEELDQAA